MTPGVAPADLATSFRPDPQTRAGGQEMLPAGSGLRQARGCEDGDQDHRVEGQPAHAGFVQPLQEGPIHPDTSGMFDDPQARVARESGSRTPGSHQTLEKQHGVPLSRLARTVSAPRRRRREPAEQSFDGVEDDLARRLPQGALARRPKEIDLSLQRPPDGAENHSSRRARKCEIVRERAGSDGAGEALLEERRGGSRRCRCRRDDRDGTPLPSHT